MRQAQARSLVFAADAVVSFAPVAPSRRQIDPNPDCEQSPLGVLDPNCFQTRCHVAASWARRYPYAAAAAVVFFVDGFFFLVLFI